MIQSNTNYLQEYCKNRNIIADFYTDKIFSYNLPQRKVHLSDNTNFYSKACATEK